MPNFESQYTFEHPTREILESLDREIEFWCTNHGVEIIHQDLKVAT